VQLDVGADQVGDEGREVRARTDGDEPALGVALDGDVGVPLPGQGHGAHVVGGAEQVTGVGGHGAQVTERAVEGDLPAGHDGDVVADLLDLVHVVRGEQDGETAVGQALDQGAHVADPAGVEAVGGLVEHQQPGVAQQAGGDAEALAHAVGVAGDLVVLPSGQVDGVEDLGDAAGPEAAVAAVEEREALEVLRAGEVGVELRALDEPCHAVERVDTGVAPGAAEDLDRAGVGSDEPEQHPEEGGLPGAVGAQDAVDLALGDLQGQVVDRDQLPVGLRDVDGLDREWGVHCSLHDRNVGRQ